MIVTVADILRHAEDFEQMLSDYYAKVSHQTTREGVRLLTDHMSRHRMRISKVLDDMSPAEVRRICCTAVRYEPQAADFRAFEEVNLAPDATAAEVLDAAVTFDECLVSLYRQAARQATDLDVKALFESLIRCEERDEIELKKIKAMDYF